MISSSNNEPHTQTIGQRFKKKPVFIIVAVIVMLQY